MSGHTLLLQQPAPLPQPQARGSAEGSPFPPHWSCGWLPCSLPPAVPLTCVGKPRFLNAARFKAKVSGHVPFGREGMIELLGKGQPWTAKAGRGLASSSSPVWIGL